MFSSPNKKQKQKTKPPFNALEIVRYAENQHVVESIIFPPSLQVQDYNKICCTSRFKQKLNLESRQC